MTRRSIALLFACAALLTAGCGSGTGSGSGASSTKKATTTPKPSPGGLKAITTPKFVAPGNGPVQSGVVNVAYLNITINPDTLRVKVGTTVRWSNSDPVDHNVTTQSGPQRFASKNFGRGQSFSVKLTRPGTIHYECTIHPATMNGTIEVLK
jgi:plastocyanin